MVLLATGGTISSRTSEAGGAVASDSGDEVLASLPVQPSHRVRVVDVFRKGSYLLTVDDMILIGTRIKEALADPQVLGVVVTHGTDTMEETAYLAGLIHDDPRPVVFTGAQQPADSRSPDGPDNLSRAIAVAASHQARDRGVLLAFAGTVYGAAGVRKSHTTTLNAFANPDFGTAGIVSSDCAVHMKGPPSRIEPLPLPGPGAGSPRVDLVAVHPGADSTLLQASLVAGAAGIVVQATGIGNANREMLIGIADATAAGVIVVTSTRVEAGPVVPQYGDGGGEDLRAAGAIPSGLLRPSQSLILLNLLLRLNTPKADVEEAFARRGRLP
ncbi:asparaginase [Paenarthrobacter sp. Z7-10]|nr:asparaginase [Paenarthrobacter sp. Z7-10]